MSFDKKHWLWVLAITIFADLGIGHVRADDSRPRVAILIFEDVQTIDYAAPLEIFGVQSFDTYTVAESAAAVTTIHGTRVIPDYTFDNAPTPDILVVPGGGRHYPENSGVYKHALPFRDDPVKIRWVKDTAASAKKVLSICNGAFVLAKAGLLDGIEATTTAPLIPMLAKAGVNIRVRDDVRFTSDGKFVTSGGLMAGIDASFHVLEQLLGRGQTQRRALGLEYDWNPDSPFVRSQLADRLMRFRFQGFEDADWQVRASEGSTDFWRNQWSVLAKIPAHKVREILERSLESNLTYRPTQTRWRRDGTPEPKATASTWIVKDGDGQEWTGNLSVQPDPDSDGRHLISLTVRRVQP